MASRKLLHKTVCVAGPGYEGLPLAEAFAEHLRTIGYRRNQKQDHPLLIDLRGMVDQDASEKKGIFYRKL